MNKQKTILVTGGAGLPANRMTSDIDTSKMRSLGWSPKKNLTDYIAAAKKQ